MADSIHWQISEALRTTLAGIEGDHGSSYWYTPDAVVRVDRWDRMVADPSREHILALRAGTEIHTEESTGSPSTGGGIRVTAEFWLLMLRRHQASTGDPFDPPSVTRCQVVDRMVRDVLRALWVDVTLGGLAVNIVAGSLEVDRDVDVEGPWAVAEARFEVDYVYQGLTP